MGTPDNSSGKSSEKIISSFDKFAKEVFIEYQEKPQSPEL